MEGGTLLGCVGLLNGSKILCQKKNGALIDYEAVYGEGATYQGFL